MTARSSLIKTSRSRGVDDGEIYSGNVAGDFVTAAPFAFFAAPAE
jgi:hypothetical protein